MPAARDSDWTHVHVAGGDRAAAAPYLPFARKLLGFVKQDAAFNRLATHQATRRLEDGALVRAELIGGIPRITIVPPPRGPGRRRFAPLFGFVTKPRQFGDNVVYSQSIATADPGTSQNAYGQDAHVLLVPEPDDADPSVTTWKSLYFDATYLPTGAAPRFYGRFRGRSLFEAGLSAHGNVDWRDATEQVALTWVGAASRTWLVGPGNLSTRFARIESTRIFHNGRQLHNHEITYAGQPETIVGACLRLNGAQPVLVYATRNGYAVDTSSSYAIRVYAVPLHPDRLAAPWFAAPATAPNPLYAPLFQPADPLQVVQLGELILPVRPNGGYGLASLFFNQSGTQARGILTIEDDETSDLGFTEIVVDLSPDLDAATFAQLDHGSFHRTSTTTTTYTEVEPAVYQYRSVEETIYAGTDRPNKVNAQTIQVDVTPSATGPYPIAVDFQDDVPVYLWYTPEARSAVTTYTSDWSSTETGFWGDGSGVIDASQHQLESTIVEVTGGRLYATDKDGATWLDLSTAQASVEQFEASSALHLSASGMSQSGTAERVRDDTVTPGHCEDRDIILWWADLRSRSVTYSIAIEQVIESTTTTSTASGGPTPTGTGYADPDSRLVSTHHAKSRMLTLDTRILFFGAQVRQMASSRTVIDADDTTEQTTLTTITPRTILASGYGTAQASGGVVVSTQDEMLLDAVNFQQQSADLSMLDGAQPMIAFEPTSTLAAAYPYYDTRWGAWVAYRNSWAYSMHDLDREDPRPLLYTHGIKDGDLAELTGTRAGVELYEQMWPIALCALPA